ncbi:MAG: hypothetical protein LBP53_06535 [Candidatus Peribacteria bacterium]|jgi:hypothetical protein|nr:hypothetical protein [Candidatus Peribacteria bacterium]
MKSHLGLFGGLLIAPLFLTACGTQSQLSFEEAKNALQEQSLFTTHQVLFDTTTPLQEDLSLTTTIQDEEQSNVVVHLTSQSQEDKLNHKGQSQL